MKNHVSKQGVKIHMLIGDIIKVSKIVHNYYDAEAVVKLNFSIFIQLENKYKLQKFVS